MFQKDVMGCWPFGVRELLLMEILRYEKRMVPAGRWYTQLLQMS